MNLIAWIAKHLTDREPADTWSELSYSEQQMLDAKISTQELPVERCMTFLGRTIDFSDTGFYMLEGQLMVLDILDDGGLVTDKGKSVYSQKDN